MKNYQLKKQISDADADRLKGSFLQENSYDLLVDHDADGYDLTGNLLFRYRKNAIAFDLLQSGYRAFEKSIEKTDGRGMASGSSHKRIRSDGSVSNITIGNHVQSGNVGYMDAGAMIHYCRKTAFARKYFDEFTAGIPFVQHIDGLYKKLCPVHYEKQIGISRATNQNYRIADTAFTTVTVNENFATAVHKDAGDYPEGFGNLIIYREGHYEGCNFCLPQYRVAINMQNCDVLFVDVHQWHGNTPFRDMSADYKRIAFVMYYREYMVKCGSPTEELAKVKQTKNGFLTL